MARYAFCLISFVVVLVACIGILMYLTLTNDQSCGAQCRSYGNPGLYLSAFGNCGVIENSSNACGASDAAVYFAAINTFQFGSYQQPARSPVCNKCVLVSGPRGQIMAKVTDVCQNCSYGDIQLSQPAFAMIVDSGQTDAPVSWGPC
ncbi:hypothetical protein GQ54DRAFT_299010 [Martensiomyces pterosporus]|nr:hypothetical protein GQ54DRAFT_299010 [Martensiomyces pterosporus]